MAYGDGGASNWYGFESDPLATDPISQGDDEIREFKGNFAEMFRIQHLINRDGSDLETDNGKHRVGATGVLMIDSTSNIGANALDGDGVEVDGAICYDKTRNCLVVWDGSAWVPITPYIASSKTLTTDVTGITNGVETTLTALSSGALTVVAGQKIRIDVRITCNALLTQAAGVIGLFWIGRIKIDGAVVSGDPGFYLYNGGDMNFHVVFTAADTSPEITVTVFQNSGVDGTVYFGQMTATVYPVIA